LTDLDDFDRRLLALLRIDGRRSNADLAAEIGLSPSACLRRLRALEQSGVIRGYTAIVADPQDEGVVALVRITLEKQTEDYLRRFEAAVREHPEIDECYLMTGDVDYILRARAPTTAAYEQIHNGVLSRLPGVARIHSSIAIRDVLRQPDRRAAPRGPRPAPR
jgi:DNA-binding Lrp family transcriptional regulator